MKRLFLLLLLIGCKPAEQATTPPAAPSNLVADSGGTTSVKLAWKDNSNNEDGFQLQRSQRPDANWSQFATTAAGTTSYVDKGRNPNVTLYYRVNAKNAAGQSAFSNVASAYTGAATPTPSTTATPTPSPTATTTPPPPTATPSPSPTSSPTPSATPTLTPLPSPTPSPSPSPPVALVTVTVNWQATKDYSYKIFYGKTNAANDMQVDGGIAFQNGPMCVTIGNLDALTDYWFSNVAIYYQQASPKGNPINYKTKSSPNQQLTLP